MIANAKISLKNKTMKTKNSLLSVFIILIICYIAFIYNRYLQVNRELKNIISQGRSYLQKQNTSHKTVFVHVIVTNDKNGIVFINGCPIFYERIEIEREHYPSFSVISFKVGMGTNIFISAYKSGSNIYKEEIVYIEEETFVGITIFDNIQIRYIPSSQGSIGVL